MPELHDLVAYVIGIAAWLALRPVSVATGGAVVLAVGAIVASWWTGWPRDQEEAALAAFCAAVAAGAQLLDTLQRARHSRVGGPLLLATSVAGWAVAAFWLSGVFPGTTTAAATAAVLSLAESVWRRVPVRGRVVGLRCPIRQPAAVLHGGRGRAINRHWPLRAQRHAVDLVVDPRGHPPPAWEQDHARYPTWDAEVVAPIAGRITTAEDDVPDEDIGARGSGLGNHVAIVGEDGIHVLLAHLRRGTIEVRVGTEVSAGDLLARCGNSGDSGEPHLHVQAMRDADWLRSTTLPIRFTDVTVRRGQRWLDGARCIPRRNDVLTPDDWDEEGVEVDEPDPEPEGESEGEGEPDERQV